MNERPTRPIDTRIRKALQAHRVVYVCATLLASLVWLSVAFARNSFTDYNDVQQVLALLTDTLPPELKSSDLVQRRQRLGGMLNYYYRDAA
jgi:hypothetical protein